MIYKALESDTNKLLSLPETGMGFQVIEARPSQASWSTRQYVVYNSEIFIDDDSRLFENKLELLTKGFATVLNNALPFPGPTESIRLVPRSKIYEAADWSRTYSMSQTRGRHMGGRGATDSPKENASGYSTYVRLSAYRNDRRVDEAKRRLIDGSFTTTLDDYVNCLLYKDDPIDRYALPNDEAIKWAFYLEPSRWDILQKGIVQPAYNHLGGGIETFFEKGTSIDTLYKILEYGKKE